MDVGELVKMSGYITQLHFVNKRTGPQLEQLLGYKAGRLGFGWALLHLTKLPRPGEFQFRGYSQMSGGIPMGHIKNKGDRQTAEEMLREKVDDLVKLKERIIKSTFRVSGPKRLVKVVPNRKPSGSKDYPPGLGIPQWELTKKLPFKVAAVILPEGRKWQT